MDPLDLFSQKFQGSCRSYNDNNQFKLRIYYVTLTIYGYKCEFDTYKDTIKVLENLYVNPRIEMFARHSLATRRQQGGDSVDQYLQVLR